MLLIDGNHLTLEEIVRVARYAEQVALSQQAQSTIQRTRRILDDIVATDKPVYGINTGFGIFAEKRIPRRDLSALSRNLILSHAVGTGRPLPEEVVRAAMLVRANTLAKGYSGVRIEIVQTLLDMLNAGVIPVVPSSGFVRVVRRSAAALTYGFGVYYR